MLKLLPSTWLLQQKQCGNWKSEHSAEALFPLPETLQEPDSNFTPRRLWRAFVFFIGFFVLLTGPGALAQSTTITTETGTGYDAGNSLSGNSFITFVVENNNAYDIILTQVDNYWNTANNNTVPTLWYSTTSLSGSVALAAPAWTSIVTAPAVPVTTNGYHPTFTNLNFVIPAGTQYRFLLQSSNGVRYSGTSSSFPTPNTFTTAGVSLKVGNAQIAGSDVGYSGANTSSSNNPRAFTGRIHFMPAVACTNPIDAGIAATSPASVCTGQTFELSLPSITGAGTGMSVQWQSSTDGITYSDLSGANTPNYTTTQTATNYYRAIVSCSGGTPDTSTAIQVMFTTGLPAGTYTINSNLPTGGTNYQSFADVIDALECGIAGQVVFNVWPGSGPYNEQVIIPEIGGASATSRVIINGNGETLAFSSSNSSERATLKFQAADYITIDSLTIEANAGSYGWGVQFIDGANNNELLNSIINSSTSSTSSSFAGIVMSGSATSATGTGTPNNNNVIEGNTVNGGYYGLTMIGSTSSEATGNTVTNNSFTDFYYYGLYLNYVTSNTYQYNSISRPTRTNSGTFYGLRLAGADSEGNLIDGNRIHNSHGGNSSSTSIMYGMYMTGADASASAPNMVVNNLIYDMNGQGTLYGFYNSSSDNVKYYHNTISLDNTASTSNDLTRGIYQTTTASGIEFINNIVSITRGGTGDNYAVYYNATGSNIISNNNVFYVVGGSGNNNIGYSGGAQTTLAGWQAEGFDLASQELNPLFVNPTTGNFRPTNPMVNNAGQPVGVLTDIEGMARSTTSPDPGAYAFSLPPCSGTPTAGTATPSVTNVCAGTNFTISLAGFTIGNGITVQWQSSPDGTTFTDLPGDTVFTFNGSQLASTYYRAAVTCNGTATAYSNVVQVTSPALFPAGIYTINSVLPTGGTNFQTFNAAVDAMQCGIAGAVTFNVVPTSGPYTEQVIIPEIYGASATSRITFNGNGEALTFASSNTDERATLKLNGADYITIDGLIINANTGTYGWGIQFINGADNNELLNSTINSITSSTSSNFAGIVMNGSATAATTAGTPNNNNTIIGNTVNGGYYGLTMTGSNGTEATGNTVSNNFFTDFYYYGMYLNYVSSNTYKYNDISRPTRTNSGVFYGLRLSGTDSQDNLIEANRIHDSHTGNSSSTSTMYGLYITGADAPAAAPNMVVNNLIYNMNGQGLLYGFYNSSSDNVKYYHNTISLDNTASTSNDLTRGFYQTTTASGIEFINNIVSVTRGGTGTNYALYFNTAGSDITSNHNVLYVSGASASHVGYSGAAQTTLADWQAEGYDLASLEVNPQFQNPATGDFEPTSEFADNIGTPVGVLADINGATRSTLAPDPGAYEFTVIVPCPAPAAITATNINCVQATINWMVADTIGEFNLHYGPVGFDPLDPTTGGTSLYSLFSAPFQLDFLTQGTTYQVYIEQDCYAAGISIMAGPITFTTSTCAPSVITGQNSFCYSGQPELTLEGVDSGFDIQWQDSTAGGSWTDIAGADSATYTPPTALTQTTWFRAITNGGSGPMTGVTYEVTVSSPLITATNTPVQVCDTSAAVTLTATASDGDVKWYDAATDGNLLHTGSNFSTAVTGDTVFYAEAATGAGSVSVGPVDPGAPLGSPLSFSALIQFSIFDVLAPTATIASVDIFPTASIGSPFTITIEDNAGTVIFSHSGVTTVTNTTSAPYTPQTVMLNAVIPQGTGYEFGFSVNPGMIRNGSGATYPYEAPGLFSITGNTFSTSYYYFFYNIQLQSGCESPRVPVTVDVSPVAPITIAGTTTICEGSSTTLSVAAPEAGVSYTWMPGNVVANSITVTPTDSAMYTVTGENALGCTTTEMVMINVNPVPVATASGNSPVFIGDAVNLSATGGMSYAWTGPNNFSSTAQNPQLSNAGIAANGTYTVIVSSNGCSDTATVEITVVDPTTPLSGGYTINQTAPASPINFTSFNSAAAYLNSAGVSGPVTITVVQGTSPYVNEQFHLGEIPGASANNTVTIIGNGETLNFCGTNGNRDIIRLDGTDWLRLQNLNIVGTCAFGWGIHLMNGADNNEITGNTVTVDATTTNIGFSQGIIAVNSFTNPATFGNAANNLKVENNIVNGGYHGIRINGADGAASTGLELSGNTINNAYEYGLYVLYNSNPLVHANTISMRAGNVRSIGVIINRVDERISFTANHVMNAGRQGVYMNLVNYYGTGADTSLIANNMIAGGMQNTTHADGLYLNFVKYARVYHNSTLVDNAGTGYSFAVTNWKSQHLDVRNNSFAYTGGGAGYAVAIGASIQNYDADFNNYYSNGSNFARMGNADRSSLTDLQSAPNTAGLHDQNSTDQDPMYVSALDLHLQPNSPLINAVGSLPQVMVDFDDQTRQGLTDMGADETGTGLRVGVQDLDVDVYPNPFRDALQVAVKGAEGMVELELIDMMGRLVYSRTVDATAVITLKPEVQMVQGVYLLKVTNNGSTSQFRVVKQ